MNVADRIRGGLHAVEEGLLTHVSGILIPCKQLAFRHIKALPAMIAIEYGSVILEEHLTADGTVDHGCDLFVGRPDVLEIYVVAGCILAEWLGLKIEVHGTGERVGNDQRRRCQIVHLDIRADAAFEVTVARQYGSDGQVVGIDGFGDFRQ